MEGTVITGHLQSYDCHLNAWQPICIYNLLSNLPWSSDRHLEPSLLVSPESWWNWGKVFFHSGAANSPCQNSSRIFRPREKKFPSPFWVWKSSLPKSKKGFQLQSGEIHSANSPGFADPKWRDLPFTLGLKILPGFIMEDFQSQSREAGVHLFIDLWYHLTPSGMTRLLLPHLTTALVSNQ